MNTLILKIMSKMGSTLRLGCAFSILICTYSFAAETPLDTNLKPAVSPVASDNDISPVFRDMGVVQRKSMDKAHKFLLANYISMDFSDGPYSMYGIAFDPGYAISDFWEVYFNFEPFFIHNQRSIVDVVHNLTLANGQQASITSPLAKHQYGVEVLWAPLYGKDSFGTRHIIHSDTFVKFGASSISYDTGDNGGKYELGVGKTFFLGPRAGLRFTIAENYLQSTINDQKSYKFVLTAEVGYMLYLF